MALVSHRSSLPGQPGRWEGGEPLWKRVPKRDGTGRAYADFMMLAPGLKGRSGQEMAMVARVIQGVQARFGEDVAFADFNPDCPLGRAKMAWRFASGFAHGGGANSRVYWRRARGRRRRKAAARACVGPA